MLGEAEHITPGVGRLIEPASAIVDDDDNISTEPVLRRPACAFFQIDRKTCRFRHNGARESVSSGTAN